MGVEKYLEVIGGLGVVLSFMEVLVGVLVEVLVRVFVEVLFNWWLYISATSSSSMILLLLLVFVDVEVLIFESIVVMVFVVVELNGLSFMPLYSEVGLLCLLFV